MSLIFFAASLDLLKTLFEVATKVNSFFALGAFGIAAVVAIIWAIVGRQGPAKQVPSMAWVVILISVLVPVTGRVIAGLAPTGTYRVTVVVEYSDGVVIPDARVTSSVGGQEKRTGNVVEYEIPASSLPSDHIVIFFADKGGVGDQGAVQLHFNKSASVTIKLDKKSPGVTQARPVSPDAPTEPTQAKGTKPPQPKPEPKGDQRTTVPRDRQVPTPVATPAPSTPAVPKNNCPQGICGDGTFDHPVVNNNGPPPAKVSISNPITVYSAGLNEKQHAFQFTVTVSADSNVPNLVLTATAQGGSAVIAFGTVSSDTTTGFTTSRLKSAPFPLRQMSLTVKSAVDSITVEVHTLGADAEPLLSFECVGGKQLCEK